MKVKIYSLLFLLLFAFNSFSQVWDWQAGKITAWTEQTPGGDIYLHFQELSTSLQPPGSTGYDQIKYFWQYSEDPGPGEDGIKYLSNTDFPEDSKYFTVQFPTYKTKILVGAKYIWLESSGTHSDYTELIEIERPVLSLEVDTIYNCPTPMSLSSAPTISFSSPCSSVFYNGVDIEFNFSNCPPGNRKIKIVTPSGAIINDSTKGDSYYFPASQMTTGGGVYFIQVIRGGVVEPFKLAIF